MKTLFTLLISIFCLHSNTFAANDSIYNFKVKSLFGDAVDLSQYKGKVLLIVNTASHCGYTPQYEGLQAIYAEYHPKGVEVLGFPSNDFGKQEPGTPKEIKSFCETKYKVSFPLFEKNPVSGQDKQALYAWLISHEPDAKGKPTEVKWNFEKFVISKDGRVVGRFLSKVKPESKEVRDALDAALK
jgi:glutathione peroxidase